MVPSFVFELRWKKYSSFFAFINGNNTISGASGDAEWRLSELNINSFSEEGAHHDCVHNPRGSSNRSARYHFS